MKMNRRWLLFGVVIFLFCALILLLRCCNADTTPQGPCNGLVADEGAVDWEGNKTATETQQEGAIAIPGFDELTFKANQIYQHVNFHNPETNNCYFLMTLYVENEEYYYTRPKIHTGRKIKCASAQNRIPGFPIAIVEDAFKILVPLRGVTIIDIEFE